MAGKLTPMMDQYLEVKQQNPDCLLFFRLGDFYEMFFEDAVTTSRELELTLTSRSCGQDEKAPMCGVPYHAAETYIQRLVQKGYKVAICEQMEDPRLAKGLVKREITRIVTPGTTMNPENADQDQNHYILSVNRIEDEIGIAVCDVTTGAFMVTEFSEEERFKDEMAKFRPQEILVNADLLGLAGLDFEEMKRLYDIYINAYEPYHFQLERCKEQILTHFKVLSLEGLGLGEMPLAVTAAGALLEYLLDTQKRDLTHISRIDIYSVQQFMMLDASTRRNLELTETMRDKSRRGSLLWVLDHTHTAMGGRMLRRWLEQPLIEEKAIQERLDCVEAVANDPMLSEELKEALDGVYDMERLMGRVCYGSAGARDLIALKNSLGCLPVIKELLKDLPASRFAALGRDMDTLSDLFDLLEASIYEEPPITLREGRLIKAGYNEMVDTLRSASTEGKTWLMDDVLPYLGNDDWYGGFLKYIELAADYLRQAREGNPVDYYGKDDPWGGEPVYPTRSGFYVTGRMVMIALIVGLIPALVTVLVMKSKMKSAKLQTMAENYQTQALQLRDRQDRFLRKDVTRVRRDTDSGGSRGGGGHGTSVHSSGFSHHSGKF